MLKRLLLVITVLILVITTLPAAGSSAQQYAYPAPDAYPAPGGHVIADDGGGGRASAPKAIDRLIDHLTKIRPAPAPRAKPLFIPWLRKFWY